MNLTRKQFCGGLAGGTVLLVLHGCGGGDGGSPAPAPNPSPGCGASGTAIGANHGHVLTMARTDLDSTVDKTYDITGSGTHGHTVLITAAQFAMLKAGQTVTVQSSPGGAPSHDHAVSASCV